MPFIAWLRRYDRHYQKADLFAGLTAAVVALPPIHVPHWEL
jgi:MFS superfamily sulfate permease-like transporter